MVVDKVFQTGDVTKPRLRKEHKLDFKAYFLRIDIKIEFSIAYFWYVGFQVLQMWCIAYLAVLITNQHSPQADSPCS